ncbi:MAG: A24 family peptidase [Betaproteobacteria bacterium]|nr:A24 family peptidase [Betaproteobacteria bacterium]
MTLLDLLRQDSHAFVGLSALVGLMIGSFLNVVIHRLPRMLEREWAAQCGALNEQTAAAGPLAAPYNLVVPRSACPSCHRPIGAWENIPVLSYLWLRGRCAGCRTPISFRYPAVEIACAAAAGYLAAHFGFGVTAVAAMLFVFALIALSVIDFDTQLLPDSITQPLLWAGLLVNLWGVFVPLRAAVIGAVAGYLTLWSIYWLFKLATGKDGMGFGDFKLLAAIGAWLGWRMLPLVILLSSITGAIVGVALIAIAKRGRQIPIPFGPYLAAGGFVALLWGAALTRAYLGG